MAFEVVDPNVPSATANSYIDVAAFKSFHIDRNVTAVVDAEFDDTQIQGALVQATDYVDKKFGRNFRGWKRTRVQRLEWPRIDAYDNDNYLYDRIPTQLVSAIAEYALLALQLGRNLAPVPVPGFAYIDPANNNAVTSAGSGQVVKTRDKAGPLESEVQYADTGSLTAYMAKVPEYPQADFWLKELTRSARKIVRG